MNIQNLKLGELKELAKKVGAKGCSRMNKGDIIKHLHAHVSSGSGMQEDIGTAKGTGSEDKDVSDRLRTLVSGIQGAGVKEKSYSKVSCAKGKGVEEDPIDWDDIKWGSFSEQLRRYNETHKNKFEGEKALCKFAEMILNNKSKYSTTTKRRASFYLNVLAKKKCA